MHGLIAFDPAMPAHGMLTEAEVDATMAYAQAEKAASTRAAYASDWADFAAWCAHRGATALPAQQGIVAAYLSALAHSLAAGNRPTSAAGQPPSATTISWPATRRRPTRRP